ncbi:trans-4-hydroxy-L-proline dehydratase [Desulfotruncus alcoholivorax]|uniref:trans-4-hydroxy-L-proline dehydratase n=1 Tax=Desulfotruncus alcoholivorax TaxID=265477 RepID=UPI000423E9C9|nr:trans-4-hydroxy-L-proline dehydratase [Desulfotruncus alcoholivorax]
MMNERVATLREQSLKAEARVSTERAELMTRFYKSAGVYSAPVLRALAFKFLMENKAIYIGDGELIVGERGPAPKATPTYPELCCHSLQDLEILNSREKVSYTVSEEARRVYEEEIIPFWRGRSMRDIIFDQMTAEWKDAYDSGIFTEFMEQRAPGHTVLDDKIYRKGFLDFKKDIAQSLEKLDYLNDPDAYNKQEQLKAMAICADAIIAFARRHAEKALEMARFESNPTRKKELEKIAEVCHRVPAHAPANFWEVLQCYWFVHLGVITELNTWDAFNPGRLDQHLYPFYKQGLEEGSLTKEQARELLQCFWIKFNNQPAPPKVGVTAEESGTYTDFANINSGGLKPDGSDGVNEVTYLILDVIDEMRLLQPSSNIQLSKKNPDRFLKRACKIIRKGWGQPSIFNADMIVEELLRQGKSIEDARCGGASGCVETGAFGKESYILTGYFNLVKILELTLNNGIDPRTGRQLGLKTGDPAQFKTIEDLLDAFKRQLKYFIDVKIKGNNIIERLYAAHMPAPFLSIVIDDCIAKGKDYNDGGARYNTNYIQGVGLGSITDCISAIKYHVFDQHNLTMQELLEALRVNFAGREKVRLLLLNKTPRYGNDDDYADDIMKMVFDIYYNEVNGRKNTKGGVYRINLLPTTCHVYFGSVIGATPDGRKAGEPLSEGISPVQGADRKGPTAVIKSAAKMDHARTGGTLLNQKFTPQVLEGDSGIDNLAHLVRSYFKMDGHHIQFNVVDAATLREAQANPEKYRDLIVRVAGYSDYFCDLSRALQDEIIARTEHKSF